MSMIWIGVLVLAAPPLGVPSSTAATAGTATPAVSLSATPGAQAGSPQARLGSGRKLADAVHAALHAGARQREECRGGGAASFSCSTRNCGPTSALAIDERGELRGLVRGRLVRLSKMIAAAAARHAIGPAATRGGGEACSTGGGVGAGGSRRRGGRPGARRGGQAG